MTTNIDIGTAAGFSQMTQGSIADLAATLGINPSDWDIREATYTGGGQNAKEVKFHVFKNKGAFSTNLSTPWSGALPRISDSGGRRKVKYQYPYVNGQTTDDLGRKPETFELEILIFGQNYMECFNQLKAQFDDPVPGVLIHPVRGQVTCGVESYTLTHQSDQRKAMGIHVTFIEHNFSIATALETTFNQTIKSALSKALTVFAVIDLGINKVTQAKLMKQGVKAIVTSYMALYKQNSAATLSKLNTTFNTKSGSSDIPALLPVNIGGISQPTTNKTSTSANVQSLAKDGSSVKALNGLSSAFGNIKPPVTTTTPPPVTTSQNFPVVASINDSLSNVPLEVLSNPASQAVAITQLKRELIDLTTQTAAIISTIEENGGALELFDTIQSLRQSIVDMQAVLVTGISSSRATLNVYVTPRVMSIREVCFQNGISLSRTEDVINLNKSLLSVNQIEKGTMLMVPSI